MLYNSWLMLVFVLTGAGAWLVAHRAQETARLRLWVVRPPRWVALLCGDPWGDGTIELEQGVRQLSSFIFLLGGPLTFFLGLELRLQAALVFLAYALLAFPVLAVVEWIGWCAESRKATLADLVEPGVESRPQR